MTKTTKAAGKDKAETKTNLPVNVKAQLSKEAAELGDRIKQSTGDKVKLTKAKTFKLPDGSESAGPLTCVILDFVAYNRFDDKPYKEGDPSPPACFAIGFLDNDKLTPSAKSPDKQSDGCAKCPNNEWGSKGEGKACKNKRLLAIVPGAGDLAGDPNAPMWVVEVSPTALKAFDAYVATVKAQFDTPPIGVVTDIFFDPTSSAQSLRFGNPQENPNLELHFSRRAAAKERLTQEPDVSKYEAPKKAGTAKKR